ncbi:hypothetical protein B296_00015349 [Ensete ventricosum]|uniref:Uncharacterized protein n=1 Tax=Ensete ventricosum TaxID=4639 RepID=A0A426Z8T6_ENSVE|nr:hypothetical protein B296_00015349 [Ensete ventricosum]
MLFLLPTIAKAYSFREASLRSPRATDQDRQQRVASDLKVLPLLPSPSIDTVRQRATTVKIDRYRPISEDNRAETTPIGGTAGSEWSATGQQVDRYVPPVPAVIPSYLLRFGMVRLVFTDQTVDQSTDPRHTTQFKPGTSIVYFVSTTQTTVLTDRTRFYQNSTVNGVGDPHIRQVSLPRQYKKRNMGQRRSSNWSQTVAGFPALNLLVVMAYHSSVGHQPIVARDHNSQTSTYCGNGRDKLCG